jgi:hypothetical protein
MPIAIPTPFELPDEVWESPMESLRFDEGVPVGIAVSVDEAVCIMEGVVGND